MSDSWIDRVSEQAGRSGRCVRVVRGALLACLALVGGGEARAALVVVEDCLARARRLAAADRFEAALGVVESAIQARPDDVELRLSAGFYASRAGLAGRAVAHYRAALVESGGQSVRARSGLAWALLESGDACGAAVEFEGLAAEASDLRGVARGLAVARRRCGLHWSADFTGVTLGGVTAGSERESGWAARVGVGVRWNDRFSARGVVDRLRVSRPMEDGGGPFDQWGGALIGGVDWPSFSTRVQAIRLTGAAEAVTNGTVLAASVVWGKRWVLAGSESFYGDGTVHGLEFGVTGITLGPLGMGGGLESSRWEEGWRWNPTVWATLRRGRTGAWGRWTPGLQFRTVDSVRAVVYNELEPFSDRMVLGAGFDVFAFVTVFAEWSRWGDAGALSVGVSVFE